MADPVTFTASAIAQLAFQEFLKTSAGELAKKFSAKAESGDEQALKTIAAFLNVEMLDPGFGGRVQAIAQEIQAGKLLDQSSMVQNNSDNATGYQIKNEGGENYIGNVTVNNH